MTRATAIDLLDNLIGMVEDNHGSDYDTAFHMAIDALKCSEIPNSSDTISRQAAIDYVDDVPYIKEHPNIGLLWKAWLEQLPSAQPERKKGKWIEHNPHKWGLGIVFECSECGEKIDCEPSNFCPNCGADMRGEG